MVKAKIILSIATFLLINLPLNTSYADSDIAALGNLKGIYVNLKINDRTPQGVPKQRIDKKKLLKYVEKELINTIGKERGIRLFKAIDPHLNVEVIIEGQEHHAADRLQKYMYYVTVKASLERNAVEWYREHTAPWSENAKYINAAKKRVKIASENVAKAKKNTKGRRKNSFAYTFLEVYKTNLINAKKNLVNTINRYAIGRTAEVILKTIVFQLTSDYKVAKNIESEYKKKEQEVEELSKQLGDEEETISLQQKDERYVESKVLSRANVLYEIGNTIKLRNPSDTVFALYKDESLSNITNLFSNGIKASIIDYKALPDKPVVYKIQIPLKDGSEYIGWVSESVISK